MDLCSRLENNLILDTYSRILAENGKPVAPLAIRMHNNIPLGMGCGSSAAGRAGCHRAWPSTSVNSTWCTGTQFSRKPAPWKAIRINAAASWLGGFVAAAPTRERQFAWPAGQSAAELARNLGSPLQSPWRPARPVPCFPRPTPARTWSRISRLSPCSDSHLPRGEGIWLHAAMQESTTSPYRAEIRALCCPVCFPWPEAAESSESAERCRVRRFSSSSNTIKEVAAASEAILRAMQELPTPKLMTCRFEEDGAKASLYPKE